MGHPRGNELYQKTTNSTSISVILLKYSIKDIKYLDEIKHFGLLLESIDKDMLFNEIWQSYDFISISQ